MSEAVFVEGLTKAYARKTVVDHLDLSVKSGYTVHVLSDFITSYDKKKLPELLAYYESKGCEVVELHEAERM